MPAAVVLCHLGRVIILGDQITGGRGRRPSVFFANPRNSLTRNPLSPKKLLIFPVNGYRCNDLSATTEHLLSHLESHPCGKVKPADRPCSTN